MYYIYVVVFRKCMKVWDYSPETHNATGGWVGGDVGEGEKATKEKERGGKE